MSLFVSWDTHENARATTAEEMKKAIDRPVTQLILDLKSEDYLDRPWSCWPASSAAT